jgi:hypothetical protein
MRITTRTRVVKCNAASIDLTGLQHTFDQQHNKVYVHVLAVHLLHSHCLQDAVCCHDFALAYVDIYSLLLPQS